MTVIFTTLTCYFSFLYFYLAKNDLQTLATIDLPMFMLSPSAYLPWAVLACGLLPWWWLFGFEVGVALWLTVLSLVSLIVVVLYPLQPQRLLLWSRRLFFFTLLLIAYHIFFDR